MPKLAWRAAVVLLVLGGCAGDERSSVPPPPSPPSTQEPTPSPAARRWVQELRSDDPDLRREASDQLERLGEEAREALTAAAREEDLNTQSNAVLLLRILEVRAALTPGLRATFPGVSRKLTLGQPHLWTELFLDATTESDEIRKYPTLERSDWNALVGRALQAAEPGQELIEVFVRISRFRLKGASSVLLEKARGPTKGSGVRENCLRLLGEIGTAVSAEDLLPFVEFPEAEIREEAARALGSLGLVAAKPALVALLRDQNDRVRSVALASLADLGATECAPSFLAGLQDSSFRVKEAAWIGIVKLRREELVDDLIALLSHPDYEIQDAAVSAVAGLRARRAIPALIEMLKQRHELVVLLALRALVFLKAREAAAAVAALSNSPSASVRAQVLTYLGETRTQGYEAVVLKALEDPNPEVRRAALRAVGILEIREAVPQLLALLLEEGSPMRSAAAQAAMSLRDPRIMAAARERLARAVSGDPSTVNTLLWAVGSGAEAGDLLPFLGHPDYFARRQAAHALFRLGVKDRLAELKALTRSARPDTRMGALELLGMLGDASCLDEVLRASRDESPLVRRTAAQAAGGLGAGSLETLLPLLSDPEYRVRGTAAAALGRVGETSALPKLEGLLKDPSLYVRSHAAESLCKLGSDSGVEYLLEHAELHDGRSDLSALNALQEPRTWRRLVATPWPLQAWMDAEDSDERLAQDLGFKVLSRLDARASRFEAILQKQLFQGSFQPTLPNAVDVVEFSSGLHYADEWAIEGSTLRMMQRREALAYWSRWWTQRTRSGK